MHAWSWTLQKQFLTTPKIFILSIRMFWLTKGQWPCFEVENQTNPLKRWHFTSVHFHIYFNDFSTHFYIYTYFYTTGIILQEPGWMRHILCSEFCMSSTLSDLGRSPTKEKGRLYLTLYMRYHISHMKWYFKKII